jgi:hypothetical protein
MAGLSRLSIAKISFALAGILTFGTGIRWQNTTVRWAGIALVAVAWFLRFAAPRAQTPATQDAQLPDETR